MKRSGKPTIHDVALRAGVSITTVSRAINGSPLVDPETARRVSQAIDELAYLPDSQARTLVSGRSRLLGLVVSDITNPFFPDLVKSFEDMVVADGYELLVSSTNYDPQRMTLCIRRMIERKADGVAIMTSEMDDALIGQLAGRHVPMAFLDVAPVMAGVYNVEVDYAAGIEQAISHLAALGHRRIGFVSGPRTLRSANVRRAAFLASLERHGLQGGDAPVVEGDHKIPGGMAAGAELLALRRPPTAVLASNDLTALGVLAAVRRAGLQVPRDLSVVGFDDIWPAELAEPPLTTVRLCRGDIAGAAYQALRLAIGGKAGALPRSYPVPTRLVVRQSTSAV